MLPDPDLQAHIVQHDRLSASDIDVTHRKKSLRFLHLRFAASFFHSSLQFQISQLALFLSFY